VYSDASHGSTGTSDRNSQSINEKSSSLYYRSGCLILHPIALGMSTVPPVVTDEDILAWAAANPWLCLVDSINQLTSAQSGRVVLSGSHGGLYSVSKGRASGPRGLIFNDAGVGLNEAGTASLIYGETWGVAVCVIAHDSARIGDARDMLRRGFVSAVNALARAASIMPGMACMEAASRLSDIAPAAPVADDLQEYRHEVFLAAGTTAVCIDSASLIAPEDEGRLVVTGSHGGLIGGKLEKAINVAAAFAAFNDAGVGRDEAGLGRLGPLDARGIAAVTVGHMSAEIGNALSSLEGVISHANAAAVRLGARSGLPLRPFLEEVVAAGRLPSAPASP
jgi:hypothetical protein